MTTKNDKPNQPAPRYDDVHADGEAGRVEREAFAQAAEVRDGE